MVKARRGFPSGSVGKESTCNEGDLGWEDPLEKEMATQSSTPAWRIPWTEEQGGLQSMGLQRVGQDCATNKQTITRLLEIFIFKVLAPISKSCPSLSCCDAMSPTLSCYKAGVTISIHYLIIFIIIIVQAGSSVGKESACNAGDPGLIPGSGRSPGEGIGYPLQYSWASLVAQMVKNLPVMWKT